MFWTSYLRPKRVVPNDLDERGERGTIIRKSHLIRDKRQHSRWIFMDYEKIYSPFRVAVSRFGIRKRGSIARPYEQCMEIIEKEYMIFNGVGRCMMTCRCVVYDGIFCVSNPCGAAVRSKIGFSNFYSDLYFLFHFVSFL